MAASAEDRRRRGSVHLAVAEAVDRLPLIGVPSWLRPITGSVMESAAGSQADPEYRVFYVRSVTIAWLWLALLSGFLMVPLAYVVHLFAGERGNQIGAAVGLALCFFCLTGAAYAMWRECFALLARHRAKTHGVLDDRYEKLVRHATLRNSSLVLQVAVGAFTLYVALANGSADEADRGEASAAFTALGACRRASQARQPARSLSWRIASTAFIVGGTGQIGRAVSRRLTDAGWDVTVAARNPPENDDLPFVRLDRTADGQLESAIGDGVDVLIDVIPLRVEDGAQLGALAGRVGSVVAISTAGVYADAEGRSLTDPEAVFPMPISERQATVPPGPDDYHATKRAIELALLEDERLRATIVRPCAIHGPGGKQLREWYFVKRALDKRRFVVLAHRGSGRFHTTSVDNLAEVVRLAAQRPAARVVNCGDPDPPTVLEIARAIAAVVDAEWTEVLLPAAEQGSVGDHPWNTRHPFVLDMTTAEIELGYRPIVRYEQAVERTVAWLVEATRDRPWQEVLTGFADYPAPLLDYEAEDAFLRSLSS